MTTITTRTGTYYDEPDTMLIIEATENNEVISALYANPDTRQIMAIETTANRQGEGHARSLIDYAVANDIELYHSPEWSCTPEGWAFAQACDDIDIIDDEDAYGWEDYQANFAA